jgi:hypothetical protein
MYFRRTDEEGTRAQPWTSFSIREWRKRDRNGGECVQGTRLGRAVLNHQGETCPARMARGRHGQDCHIVYSVIRQYGQRAVRFIRTVPHCIVWVARVD